MDKLEEVHDQIEDGNWLFAAGKELVKFFQLMDDSPAAMTVEQQQVLKKLFESI